MDKNRPGNQAELRTELAKRVHVSDVPEDLWTYLVEQDYMSEILECEDDESDELFSELVSVTERLLRLMRAGAGRKSPPGRKVSKDTLPTLSLYEDDHAQAFSRFLARQAAATPDVQDFRTDILGGTILSPEEANALLASPAPRFLSPAQFKTFGIPIVGHQARIVDQQQQAIGEDKCCTEVTLRIEWPGRVPEGAFRWERPTGSSAIRWLEFPLPGDRPGFLIPWPASVFDELRQLSVLLTTMYPWKAAQATWFVLTDVVPYVAPVRVKTEQTWAGTYSYHRITLSAEPWVPVNTIAQAYRAAQRQVRGGDNRPLSPRSIALFFFVNEQTETDGKRPTWEHLIRHWNRTYPEWSYNDVWRFARDFRRAEKTMLTPPYRNVALEHVPKEGGPV